jgi:hypothetical protein
MIAESPITLETLVKLDDILRIGRRAVRRAQEDSRRLGIPNVYSMHGLLYYELPSGELTRTDPWDPADLARNKAMDQSGR